MVKKIKINIQSDDKIQNKDTSILDFGGTLLQLETHSAQFRKGITKAEFEKFTQIQRNEWVKFSKQTIDKKHLIKINNIISSTRFYVIDASLPFPIKGFYLIPNVSLEVVKNTLGGFILKLKRAVANFAKEYEQYIKEAREVLEKDGIFNINDYPMNIHNRFSINYRFINLTVPSHINESMREKELIKFQQMVRETRETGILALRQGFADIITNLADTLSGKLDGERKRLYQVSIDKVEQFFNSFKSKNLFHDNELENVIANANDLLSGISAKDLHNDIDLTKEINSQLKNVKTTLNSMITNYKRKITI